MVVAAIVSGVVGVVLAWAAVAWTVPATGEAAEARVAGSAWAKREEECGKAQEREEAGEERGHECEAWACVASVFSVS